MIFEGITALGKVYSLGTPLTVHITKGAGAPADEFVGEFSWSALPPLYRLRVLDGQKVIFYGPLDVQQERHSPKGDFVRVEGRSMAALLLDNEAVPQMYYSPPFSTVFSRHALPYGFLQYHVPKGTVKIGDFSVTKGMSEWQVLESFCRRAWNAVPTMQGGDVLTVGQAEEESPLAFRDLGLGLGCLSRTKTRCEYARISEVLIRNPQNGRYTVSYTDEQALRDGIRRRRCMGASQTANGRQVAQNAMRKSLKYTWVLPEWPNIEPGKNAEINDRYFGRVEGLTVWSTKYSLDASGMVCTVTLRQSGG